MPFYVSPEQSMRDKADYARKGVARSRSSVALQYAGGILMVTPNISSVLHKISEIYDRIAFAAVGLKPDGDQIYRISWDGSVSDEPGFVAFGGQADQVTTALKERFSDGMSLTEALGAALAALAAPAAASGSAPSNGSQPELTADKLEVAILDRARPHRTF